MHSSFWSLKFRVHPGFCSLIFRVHPWFCSIQDAPCIQFYNIESAPLLLLPKHSGCFKDWAHYEHVLGHKGGARAPGAPWLDPPLEKESIMVVWCKLKVPSLRITVRHHSASLAMLNNYRRDRIFNPLLTAIKNSYNKENVQWSNICYTRIWDIFCPYLCYIRKCNMAEPMLHTKIWYLSASALFFYI